MLHLTKTETVLTKELGKFWIYRYFKFFSESFSIFSYFSVIKFILNAFKSFHGFNSKDKKSLFEIEVRKNLRLCAMTGWIPICSGDGYQTAIMLRQPLIVIRYWIPVVLSRRNFAINWLTIRDFRRRKPVFPSVILKIGLRRIIRIYNPP